MQEARCGIEGGEYYGSQEKSSKEGWQEESGKEEKGSKEGYEEKSDQEAQIVSLLSVQKQKAR